MQTNEAVNIVKMHNDCYRSANKKIGFLVQKKLKGFMYWFQHRLCCQAAIIPAKFTTAAMKLSIKLLKIE